MVVYDLKARKVKFQGGGDATTGHRTFLGVPGGRVYFSGSDGALHYYDPETNKLGQSPARLPANPVKRFRVSSRCLAFAMARS